MIYALAIFIASNLGRVYSLFDKKMKRFFNLRKGEIERVEEYFRGRKEKKVIWFHSASAGEFEQAKPLIEHLREKDNDYLIVASFFSPSGYDAGLKYKEVDFCFNFPLDYRKNANRLLDCIDPALIVYSKYDVWTNLTVEASKRGTKLVLISGTLPEKSNRHKWPYRLFFSQAYSEIYRIYAISEMDARRFRKIAGHDNKESVVVSGDTRFDRIKVVVDKANVGAKKVLVKQEDCAYFLAGSTYKVSEKKLLGALSIIRDKAANVRFILVPHEIDHENIQRLRKLISFYGFSPICYSDSSLPVSLNENEILVVDAFGVLALLYKESDIVFVGGSYKGSIHSVLEPAIFGKPLLTGPYIGNSYEAIALEEIEGLNICKSEDDLGREILKLANDNEYRSEISKRVSGFFKENLGAADFILQDMREIL